MENEWPDIIKLIQQYQEKNIEHWSNGLFSFNWWVLLVVTVSTLIAWFVILDKKKIVEIVTYGLMVGATGFLGDSIGIFFMLWQYPTTLVPVPQIVEIHIVMMPIFYMMVYQFFNTWKTFLIASGVLAFTFALILEPLLTWLGIYEMYSWKYIYSLVPYFLIAVVLKGIMHQLKQLDHHYP